MEIIKKAILKKLFNKFLESDDPFDTHKNLPKMGQIRGVGGAEAAADEIVAKLQKAGVDPKLIDYGRIVSEIEKGVLKDGMPLDRVKDSVFMTEKSRIDIETTDPTPPRKELSPEKNGPPEEGKPTEKDPVDPSDSGGEGKPQSLGLSAGTDAGDDDLENASPEARKFMKDLLEPGKPIDEIMMKRPEDLTEGEAREIMIARMDAKTHDERERLFKAEKGFFDHFFGDEPIGPDAAGRTMEPQPIRPIPQTPTPVATADGEPLGKGLRRIGLKVVRDARDDGFASVIKRLQGGLNILGEAKATKDGIAILAKLKEDGVFGPKSRSGLKRAVASLGTPKVEEGIALGHFNQFARDGRKVGFRRLKEVTEGSFGPLFRNPAKTTRKPSERLEAVTLQETLNDLGTGHFGHARFRPLGLDGDIGPKTADAFGRLAGALGPERLTRRFGEFLGFF